MPFSSFVKPGVTRPRSRAHAAILATLSLCAAHAGAQTIMPTDRGGSTELVIGIIPPNTSFPTAFNDWHSHPSLTFDGTTVNPICTNVSGAANVDTVRTPQSISMAMSGNVNVGAWLGTCNPQRSSAVNEYWVFNISQATGFTMAVSISSVTGDAADNYQRCRFFLVGPDGAISLTAGTLDSSTGIDRTYQFDTSLSLNFAGTMTPGVYAIGLQGQVRNQAPDTFTGSFNHSLTFSLGTPPAVNSQPIAQKTCPSGSVNFTVGATGSGPLAYQWQWQPPPGAAWINVVNGVNTNPNTAQAAFTGSNATTVTLTRAGGANAGNSQSTAFRCVVTNPVGNATSNGAALTICVADFNCSGLVSVQDIFTFLSAYFSNNISADFNKSGTITVQDIFAFLAAWFTPC